MLPRFSQPDAWCQAGELHKQDNRVLLISCEHVVSLWPSQWSVTIVGYQQALTGPPGHSGKYGDILGTPGTSGKYRDIL